MAKYLDRRHIFSLQGILLRCLDTVFVGYGFLMAHDIYLDRYHSIHIYAAVIAACAYAIIANVLGIYRSYDLKLKVWGLGALFSAWMLTLSLLLFFAYITKTSSIFSRVAVSGWVLATPLFLVLLRAANNFLFSHWLRSKEAQRLVAIAGYGDGARRFIKNLSVVPESGAIVSGIYTNDADQLKEITEKKLVLNAGNLKDLVSNVRRGDYSEVYITLDGQAEAQIVELIADLSDCAIPVYFVPDIFTMNLMISRVYHLNNTPIISIYDSPMDASDIVIKRIEDVLLSLVILLIAALPMLFIGLAIKLTSSGPVIFKQRRYGLGGTPIEVWKFRSMTVCDDGGQIVQATKNDRRLTALGRFMRRTSLDELPQFINVLWGDMSVVGPRPHAIAHNELYRKEIQGYMLRHLVKPGITGWAQVNGWRGETDTLEKMEMRIKYDLEYIKNWSFWFDLKIVFLTLLKGFSHKNAY